MTHYNPRHISEVAWTGTLKNLRNVYGVGSSTVGTTSSSVRLHTYVPSHMNEISLIVTLNNKFSSSFSSEHPSVLLFCFVNRSINMLILVFFLHFDSYIKHLIMLFT